MVMGQEERKNKARLEKTQAALVTSNAEYQEAIKALEGTTSRWNKEWKQACDVRSVNFTVGNDLADTFCRNFKTWRRKGSTS